MTILKAIHLPVGKAPLPHSDGIHEQRQNAGDTNLDQQTRFASQNERELALHINHLIKKIEDARTHTELVSLAEECLQNGFIAEDDVDSIAVLTQSLRLAAPKDVAGMKDQLGTALKNSIQKAPLKFKKRPRENSDTVIAPISTPVLPLPIFQVREMPTQTFFEKPTGLEKKFVEEVRREKIAEVTQKDLEQLAREEKKEEQDKLKEVDEAIEDEKKAIEQVRQITSAAGYAVTIDGHFNIVKPSDAHRLAKAILDSLKDRSQQPL